MYTGMAKDKDGNEYILSGDPFATGEAVEAFIREYKRLNDGAPGLDFFVIDKETEQVLYDVV